MNCCQRAQISTATPLLVALQSPARTVDSVTVCFECIQEMSSLWGEVVRSVCNKIESNYPSYLAPCLHHSSAQLNMSQHAQARFHPVRATPHLAFCLLYTERERSISVTSACFCVLLVERGGALESCVWFAWRPLLEEGWEWSDRSVAHLLTAAAAAADRPPSWAEQPA